MTCFLLEAHGLTLARCQRTQALVWIEDDLDPQVIRFESEAAALKFGTSTFPRVRAATWQVRESHTVERERDLA